MVTLIIEFCMGTSCHLLGNQGLLQALDELPEDKRSQIEVRGATCLKLCGKGPNVRINNTAYANMRPEKLIELIYDLI